MTAQTALDAEIEYRRKLGQRRVTMNEFEQSIRKFGFRFDRRMDCKGPARYMTGERAGQSYPHLSLCPVQVDNGIGWSNIDARKDNNRELLKASRETMFAVVHGAIADW